jgi:hypothetical protein
MLKMLKRLKRPPQFEYCRMIGALISKVGFVFFAAYMVMAAQAYWSDLHRPPTSLLIFPDDMFLVAFPGIMVVVFVLELVGFPDCCHTFVKIAGAIITGLMFYIVGLGLEWLFKKVFRLLFD